MPQLDYASVAVAIIGGDRLVGRALERALTSAGYDIRLFNGALTDGLAASLSGVRLVLLAPRISGTHREALLSHLRSSVATAELPVLELATTFDEAPTEQEGGVRLVAWPCSTEELTRRIEAALLNGAGPEPDSNPGVRAPS